MGADRVNKALKNWQKATNKLAQEFINKYFDGFEDWEWIDEVGGNLDVNQYVFNLSRIVEALEINCSYELLIQFYEYELDCYYDSDLPKYNFKTWVKYFAGFSYGK